MKRCNFQDMRRNSSQDTVRPQPGMVSVSGRGLWKGRHGLHGELCYAITEIAHILAIGNVGHMFQSNHLAQQHVESRTSVMLEMQHLEGKRNWK